MRLYKKCVACESGEGEKGGSDDYGLVSLCTQVIQLRLSIFVFVFV